MRCRVHTEPLGAGPSPDEVLRILSGEDGLACLWGSWGGKGAMVLSRPLRVVAGTAGPATLADQPRLDRADPDVVGGGWFGVLGYDAPSSYLAFYDHLLRYRAGTWHFEALWSDERDAALCAVRDELRDVLEMPPPRSAWRVGTFGGPPPVSHLDAVERAVELIRAGELYQVNVCTRLTAPFEGSPAALFAHAAARLRPAHAAFVDIGSRAVASLSPELFLRRRARRRAAQRRTVPRRMAPGLDGHRSGRRRRRRPAAGDVPARFGDRGAEGARRRGDRRTRAATARCVHRCDRI